MSRKVVKTEDISELYDLAWNQMKEDRESVVDIYNDLKKMIQGDRQGYAVSGDTLAKYAEILVRQTNQIVELIKIAHKNKDDDEYGTLSKNDYDVIHSAIDKREPE